MGSTGGGGRRRAGERGAQSLEWIALGSFVATLMGSATIYARDHGADIGGMLVNHLRGFLSQ
ncbi:MAG TPA: hypothetical protein VGQ42_06635 [Candidatus Dormibacteraeota bacterium]|jgi:hypothetical protein|nr:hypothetical protein [Candidatus Dormibacteraeota bacterium]